MLENDPVFGGQQQTYPFSEMKSKNSSYPSMLLVTEFAHGPKIKIFTMSNNVNTFVTTYVGGERKRHVGRVRPGISSYFFVLDERITSMMFRIGYH